MTERKTLKCRHCGYTVVLWAVVNGRSISGWDTLRRHMEDDHPKEFEELQKKLRAPR